MLKKRPELGSRYEILNYSVRTWCMDRTDYHIESSDLFVIDEELRLTKSCLVDSSLFILKINENREWDPYNFCWVRDDKFTVDFTFFWNSSLRHRKIKGRDIRTGLVEREDLERVACFIYDFLGKQSFSWGLTDVVRERVKNKHIFKMEYPFNYYIDDVEKRTEMMKFDFSVCKINFGMDGFDSFVMEMPEYQFSKQIDQFTDIIMSRLELKEFADFLIDSIK